MHPDFSQLLRRYQLSQYSLMGGQGPFLFWSPKGQRNEGSQRTRRPKSLYLQILPSCSPEIWGLNQFFERGGVKSITSAKTFKIKLRWSFSSPIKPSMVFQGEEGPVQVRNHSIHAPTGWAKSFPIHSRQEMPPSWCSAVSFLSTAFCTELNTTSGIRAKSFSQKLIVIHKKIIGRTNQSVFPNKFQVLSGGTICCPRTSTAHSPQHIKLTAHTQYVRWINEWRASIQSLGNRQSSV